MCLHYSFHNQALMCLSRVIVLLEPYCVQVFNGLRFCWRILSIFISLLHTLCAAAVPLQSVIPKNDATTTMLNTWYRVPLVILAKLLNLQLGSVSLHNDIKLSSVVSVPGASRLSQAWALVVLGLFLTIHTNFFSAKRDSLCLLSKHGKVAPLPINLYSP